MAAAALPTPAASSFHALPSDSCHYSCDLIENGEYRKDWSVDSDSLIRWLRGRSLLVGAEDAQANQLRMFLEAVFHTCSWVESNVLQDTLEHAEERIAAYDKNNGGGAGADSKGKKKGDKRAAQEDDAEEETEEASPSAHRKGACKKKPTPAAKKTRTKK